ncbi:MAG: carboxypeptidase-like regulatory domain-containing protein [Bacteroidota bacterium]
MPDPLKREFGIPDPDMIQDARVKHASFLEDKPDFINYDADFDDPFAANFLGDIDAAAATNDDETVLDQQAQLTKKVETEMDNCRDKFQDSKPFIVKAFPGDIETQNEFGFNDYKKAQDSQNFFIDFMLKFHRIATNYKIPLIAKNYSQLKIDEILVRYDKLVEANVAQDLFIKSRPQKTKDRILKMNKAWNGEQTICTAGKRIYKDDYAKYQRYLLPPGEETPEALSIKGKVTSSPANALEENVNVQIEANGISVFTNAQALYGIGGLPAGTYTLKFTKAGLQDKIINNVVVVDGEITNLDVVMDPV